MYHYVREYDSRYPHFKFLDVRNFKKQIQFFSDKFDFVEKQEWLDFINLGKMPKTSGKVVLTFDDAVNCHYQYVFPELRKRNLWGIFYIPTLPYTKNEILSVHKIHLLCGTFDGRTLMRVATNLVTDDMIVNSEKDKFKEIIYSNQNNYAGVSEFKGLLNYLIDYVYRDNVIDSIANTLGYYFKAADYYISWECLNEMKQKGMIIGSHTHSHPVMSKLDPKEQKQELEISFSILRDLIEGESMTYCHPYGGFQSFNKHTIDLVNKAGVKFSFNVESRDITAEDFVTSKQHLPRYDCNEFPYGTVS
ncbi:MAG: polysaccharide deacetylase family protein [Salinispira sp.]